MSPASQSSQSSPGAPGFKPNFNNTFSVTVAHPISTVYTILGTAEGHERVCRLSKLCSKMELLKRDRVEVPASKTLTEISARSFPSTTNLEDQRTLPRQHFIMTETVPLLFGLIKTDVELTGTLTWEDDGPTSPESSSGHVKHALYETTSNNGIRIWKLRTFEVVDDNTTKVSERIEGLCSSWLQPIVQKEASKAHIAHMNSYHTLFHSNTQS
ncbi:hypothetical protein BDP27DRAFT_1265683 [Rhodocollybia butyracea]|uniref:Uncharacterized protein n=1 Tax=Rhodocollybia butyracea TaxID=206335 RepID=A0A9P5PTD6_9AGAR|nr:hypothetical protein BDP27DRAFT_1265683 [Rhodocollybia butyracea]